MLLLAVLGVSGWWTTKPRPADVVPKEQLGAEFGTQSDGLDERYPESRAGHPTRVAERPLVIYDQGHRPPSYRAKGRFGYYRGLDVEFDARDPKDGSTCMRVTFAPEVASWAGIAWQSPAYDWGYKPGGYDLSEARRLKVRARGELGGEEVLFGYGLLIRDSAHFDTARGATTASLTTRWQTYTLDVSGEDLRQIKVGFHVVITSPDGRRIRFYISNIRYE